MREILTTQGVSERERLDYWHEIVRTVFWPCRIGMPTDTGYQASVVHDVRGPAEVSIVTARKQIVRRTAREIDAGPTDQIIISLQVSGYGLFSQDGRESTLRPGEATVVDAARPYAMSFSDTFSLAMFHLPRAVVPGPSQNTRHLTARTHAPTSAAFRGALSYLSCVAAVSARTGMGDDALATGVIAVSASLLEEVQPDEWGQGHTAFERAIAFIDLNLDEPTLSPAMVANACRVSTRQLYRVFSARGQHVAETIRQRRLTMAASLLRSLPAHTPISLIGTRTGFGSAEQFSRAFRETYGSPPGLWRAMSRSAGRSVEPVAPGRLSSPSPRGDEVTLGFRHAASRGMAGVLNSPPGMPPTVSPTDRYPDPHPSAEPFRRGSVGRPAGRRQS